MARVLSSWDEAKPGALAAMDAARAAKAESRKANGVPEASTVSADAEAIEAPPEEIVEEASSEESEPASDAGDDAGEPDPDPEPADEAEAEEE
jgi:hypothetical protein